MEEGKLCISSRAILEVGIMSVTKDELHKIIDRLSDSDTRSAYDYLKYLVERKRKSKTWAEIKQLLPDDEPLGKEELRQLEAPDDYITLEQAIEEYEI
jgi:hypothetical protein